MFNAECFRYQNCSNLPLSHSNLIEHRMMLTGCFSNTIKQRWNADCEKESLEGPNTLSLCHHHFHLDNGGSEQVGSCQQNLAFSCNHRRRNPPAGESSGFQWHYYIFAFSTTLAGVALLILFGKHLFKQS